MAPLIRKPAVLLEKRPLLTRHQSEPDLLVKSESNHSPTGFNTHGIAGQFAHQIEIERKVTELVRQTQDRLSSESERLEQLRAKLEAERALIKAERDELGRQAETRRQEGFEAGRLDGLAQAKCAEDLLKADLQRQFKQLMEDLTENMVQTQLSMEQQVATLAFEAICRIAGDKFLAQEGVLAIVRQVIRQLECGSVRAIRMNPLDHSILVANEDSDQILNGYALIADEQIARGGCVVDTVLGQLDARLENQLARIMAAFQEIQLGTRG